MNNDTNMKKMLALFESDNITPAADPVSKFEEYKQGLVAAAEAAGMKNVDPLWAYAVYYAHSWSELGIQEIAEICLDGQPALKDPATFVQHFESEMDEFPDLGEDGTFYDYVVKHLRRSV